MLSFVIPAHNEEAVIAQTLRALLASAEAVGNPFEVIVVDDASTDQTAEIAWSLGAKVVPVKLRKISAVRNAGAQAARGDMLIFVDADTLVPAKVLAAAVEAVRQGAVGGGARVRLPLDESVPLWVRPVWVVFTWFYYRLRLAAGCFVFVPRDAFEAVGGFDEQYFASEEVHLSRALKAKGRFVVVPEAVLTSGRKFRLFSGRQLLRQLVRLASGGREALKRREDLGLWYDGQREQAKARSGSLT